MNNKSLELKKKEELLKKIIKAQPNNANAYFNLASIYKEKGNYDLAKVFYEETIKIQPKNPSAYNNLANIYKQLGEFSKAINSYNKAISIKPNHARAYHNLGNTYNQLGKFTKAISAYKKVFKLEPMNLESLYVWSTLDEKILNLKLKKKIKSIMLNKNILEKDLAYGNFLLAIYEYKNKNFKKEIEHLLKGHQNYYHSNKIIFDQGIKYWLNDLPKIDELDKLNVPVIPSDIKPIFIIGVPRCGSTVVEKVIASSSQLIPMGEESGVISGLTGKIILSKQSIEKNLENLNKSINQTYKKIGLINAKNRKIFTDKTLENFFFLAIIKKIYPEAKVINCQRNKLSSIVSILKNNLNEIPWAHSIENIFSYIDIYNTKINNFKKQFPNFIFDLNFEKFQNNPEIEAKKLIKFCNLNWDKKCLKFYKRKDLISYTSSHKQIRKPVYKLTPGSHDPYRNLLYKYGRKYDWFN